MPEIQGQPSADHHPTPGPHAHALAHAHALNFKKGRAHRQMIMSCPREAVLRTSAGGATECTGSNSNTLRGTATPSKNRLQKRRNGVGQLTSTDIPSLPNLDDAGSLLTDLPIAYCDYEDDTERTQATWRSPQEHGPDAPPCPHIAPSRPRHLHKYLCIHDAVCSAGLPNFLGARISLQHNLHIKAWRRYAPFYNDHELPDYLEYRFPLGYMLGNMPTPSQPHHQSARCYPSHVDHYITMELDAFALCGPFPKPPFNAFQINPLMTAPKKHSDMRRVILDLSHPDGASVNSGIPRDSYLGVPYKLSLPSAQDLRDLIIAQGQGCHLWSIDLQRGFRQLRVCPMDWPLLGIAWDGAYYFDTAVPLGIRWGAMYMQRTTPAVTNLAHQHHIPCITYIDDVASAQPPSQALNCKRRFQALLVELSLEENASKGSKQSRHMTWLGVDHDSEAMTMAVPVDKIRECQQIFRLWVNKEHCTKSQLRKYLRKLFHICQCCPTLYLFVNRMLETLKAAHDYGSHPISPAFRADLHWILQYLPLYNGVQMIPRSPTLDTSIAVDSCLTGGGGHFGPHIYHTVYPYFI